MDCQGKTVTEARLAVLGLGNILMGDDAWGPYLVRVLEAGYCFPEDVVLRDLGTPGLDLTPHVTGLEAIVLVDTVLSAGVPGELRQYRKADLLRRPPSPPLNAHDPGVGEALLLADAMGLGPAEVLLVGVIPERIAPGVGLSAAVRRALEPAAAAVLGELSRLGRPAVPRRPAPPPDAWWEAAAPAHG